MVLVEIVPLTFTEPFWNRINQPVSCLGCVLLHDGPCELSSSKWRLLLGLTPGKTKDLEMGQWQSWFDHLQHQSHWLFVVRRSGAFGQSWHTFAFWV